MKRRLRVEELETRDCPAAGSRLIPLASGPGYNLSVNTFGRVAVMQVTQDEFDIWLDNDGDTEIADEALIMNRIYPVMGDVFDFGWKANERNFALLMRHRGDLPKRSSPRYWLAVSGLLLAGLICVAAPVVLVVWLVLRLTG